MNRFFILVGLVGLAIWGLVVGLYIYQFGLLDLRPLSSDPDRWGTFGDYVGGILNPIFSFTALMGLAYTPYLQKLQLNEALRQAGEAKIHAEREHTLAVEANRIARDSVVATDRPWLKMTVQPAGQIAWDGNELTCHLEVTFENVGKNPALRVDVHAEAFAVSRMYPDRPPLKTTETYVASLQTSARMRARLGFGLGTVLYPGQTDSDRFSTGLDENVFPGVLRGGADWYHLNVLVAVEYWLPGDNARPRYVADTFAIGPENVEHGGVLPLHFSTREGVTADNVRLVREPFPPHVS